MVETYPWTGEDFSWVAWPSMDGSFTDEEIDQTGYSSVSGGGCLDCSSFPVSNLGSWASDAPAAHHPHQQTAVFGGGRTKEIEGFEAGMSSSTNVNIPIAGELHTTSRSQAEEHRPGFLSKLFSTADHATELGPNQSAILRPQSTPGSSAAYGARFGLTNTDRFQMSSDDEAMMRAMLVVLSSSGSPAPDEKPLPPRRVHGAFEPYVAGRYSDGSRGAMPAASRSGRPSMVKELHSKLRKIQSRREAEAATTSNQLHHKMSERKRREKLKESFHALQQELPPRTRKDKASLLAAAKEQLIHLKAQISDLKGKNQVLEMHLPPLPNEEDHDETSIRRSVRFEMNTTSTTSTSKKISRIMITAECDINDLAICVLGRLKQIGKVDALESMVAKYISSSTFENRACTLTLELQAQDEDGWDECALAGAITGAVEEAEAAKPTTFEQDQGRGRLGRRPGGEEEESSRREQM